MGVPVSTVQYLTQSMRISHYGVALMTTAFMYDFLTALDEEVEYVWKAKRSLTKLLFLSNRYNTILYFGLNLFLQFFPSPSEKFCQITASINYLVGLHVMMVGTGVLLLRTWALFGQDRRLLMTFIIVYSITLTGLTAFTVKAYFWGGVAYIYRTALDRESVSTNVSMIVPEAILIDEQSALDVLSMGCYFTGFPKDFFAIFLAGLFFESALFSLSVYQIWRLRLGTGLVVMLFRDGMIYYVIIMAAHLCATVMTRSEGLDRALLGSSFYVGIKSIAISHLILRLRGYLVPEPELNAPDPVTYDQTDIRFAPPTVGISAFGGAGDGGTMRSVEVNEGVEEWKVDPTDSGVPSEGFELKERKGSIRSPSDLEVGSSGFVNITHPSENGAWFTPDSRWGGRQPSDVDEGANQNSRTSGSTSLPPLHGYGSTVGRSMEGSGTSYHHPDNTPTSSFTVNSSRHLMNH